MFHDEVDVLFTSFFEEEDFDRGIYYTKRMICCSQMAYMLKTNPLSKREKLYFSDLRNQNFISLSPSKSPNYMKNAITRYSAEAGFIPKIAYFVQSSESISENEFGEYDIFIADQYPRQGGVPVMFLNQQTIFFAGAEFIARRLGLPVVYLDMEHRKRGSYHMKFSLICEDSRNTQRGFITREYARLLEEHINLDRHNWLWSHKRWKRGFTEKERKECENFS